MDVREGGSFRIPPGAGRVMARLEAAGFAAYAVGGCIRDSLMGQEPHDWDVCTSALPAQTLEVFSGERVIPTGLAHGTVTVHLQGEEIEVTTMRRDGAYSDGRHPDRVDFVSRIEEDLSRRDFTVNAMAYSPVRGFADPFGGRGDLAQGVLRCVGDPRLRFEEDALRILRALRFASTKGLRVEAATAAACREMAGRLSRVSRERITSELLAMMEGRAPGRVLDAFHPVLFAVLPDLSRAEGFLQHSPWHSLDVLGHLLCCTDAVDGEGLTREELQTTRLAALLHDVGKPETFGRDAQGIGHFRGHADAGCRRLEEILRRDVRLSSARGEQMRALVKMHDVPLRPEARLVRRLMSRLGERTLRMLLRLHRADLAAHGEDAPNHARSLELIRETEAFGELFERMLPEMTCLSVRDLAVSGRDLMSLGVPAGPEMGALLGALLEEVLDGKLDNRREELMEEAQRKWRKEHGNTQNPGV